MSRIVGVFTALLTLGIYVWTYDRFALWQLPASSPWTWLFGLARLRLPLLLACTAPATASALFWAAHVVHHQSEHYNLSTALRQTSSGWLAGWIFYLPMALAGFPPLVFGVVALIDLLYQFWVHTEQVGRLGWFDRWFCCAEQSPRPPRRQRRLPRSQLRWRAHRLGSPVRHLTWRKIDAVPCLYGTRAPLRSWNPLWANLQVYCDLARDARRARRWRDKLRIWLAPPGWRPDDVAARWPKPAFSLGAFERWSPEVPRTRVALAFVLFVAMLGATMLFLWYAHALTWSQCIACGGAIVLGLWGVGRLSEGTSRQPRALSASVPPPRTSTP